MAGMKNYVLFILAIVCFINFGCQPKLERKGVPVWVGISIGEDCEAKNFIAQKEVFKYFPLAGLQIEVPLEVNGSENAGVIKYYEDHALDTLVRYLRIDEIPFSLAFNLENPRNVSLERIDWKKYFTSISGILLRTFEYPPQQIIFMGEWVNPQLPDSFLTAYIDQIDENFEPFKGEIIYGFYPEMLHDSIDWETPDKIGIRFTQSPEENAIPYYQKTNKAISQKLMEWQKPGIVLQTNLIGEEKLNTFKYQLRYWDEKTKLDGIVLNSLYCDLSLAEKESYFALGKDDDFLAFLKNYFNR